MHTANPSPLLALLLLSLAGCGWAQTSPISQRFETRTFGHDEIERTYHITYPSGFDRNRLWPLVLAFHGGGGAGRQFDRNTSGTLLRAADQLGFLAVFPEGVNRVWNDGRTAPGIPDRTGTDDVRFISTLIDHLIAQEAVDPKRVFATGISNGGFFSFRLGCDLPDKIAAIAPVAACMPLLLANRHPRRTVSVLVMNGTEDPMVPYEGGEVRLTRLGRSRGRILSTDDSIRFWTQQNSCQSPPTRSSLPDLDPDDQTRVYLERFSGGRNSTEVLLYRIEGGGHTWPGGEANLPSRWVGRICRDINASRIILKFFQSHPQSEE